MQDRAIQKFDKIMRSWKVDAPCDQQGFQILLSTLLGMEAHNIRHGLSVSP